MCLCSETERKISCAWARCNLDGNIDFHAVRVTRAWAVALAVVEPTHNQKYIENSANQYHTYIYICISYTHYLYIYGTWIHSH